MEISIVIKALNEEKNIARSISSAKEAIKGMKGEVILADSLSTDRTVEIAKNFDIKIVQLVNSKDRSCGVGPQIGYIQAKGKYIYILDGDMELNKDFIKRGIKEFEADDNLAGVSGKIIEMTDTNIVFKRRKHDTDSFADKEKYETKLMMGGLYKKEAIDKVGYFSNPNLHAYEESDLGNRLTIQGYRMKRIPHAMVKHYGGNASSIRIYKNRWKSRYLWGCGEYLRANICKKTLFMVVKELMLYLAVLFWWAMLIIFSLMFYKIPQLLLYQLVLTGIFLILFLLKKRNLYEFTFSIFSWNFTALGLLFGFFKKQKDVNRKIEVKLIK